MLVRHNDNLLKDGFTVIENIYTNAEIVALVDIIDSVNSSNPTFRKNDGLFAIRQFLKQIPGISKLIFNDTLTSVIDHLFGNDYFVVKSIYFDKPELSNWFVAFHQDLTISVDKKLDLPGYNAWTNKHNQFAVQPPQVFGRLELQLNSLPLGEVWLAAKWPGGVNRLATHVR